MTHVSVLDPGASALDFYGYELRRYREAAGLTQQQLGAILHYTGSLVGQIETARKVPTVEFSQRVDAALNTDGVFSRLLPLVLRSQLPIWFQQVAELEARAVEILTFQTDLVHGLLQTPEYARAVLGTMSEDNLDNRVSARMGRQLVFEKPQPLVFWLIMSEAVLMQRIGGSEVMRGQLAHLLSYEHNPRINVQIMPFDVGEHAGAQGSFTVFRFDSDPSIVYTEGYDIVHPTANPETVTDCSLRYDHLQAAALSVRDSAGMIRRVMEERYGQQHDSAGGDGMA